MSNCSVNVKKKGSLICFLEPNFLPNNLPVGVLESSELSANEAYARHSYWVDWWVTDGTSTLQTCKVPPQPPTLSALFSSSVYPSLSPLALIMALGPGEWMTEVNTPRRKRAIVNEAEVKMSGWNRQIKEMKDEVDVWWGHVKRDWHSSEENRRNEKGPENYKLLRVSYDLSFLSYLSCSGTFTLTTHYSDQHWLLLHILSCYLFPFSNV